MNIYDYSELFSIYKGLLTEKQKDVFSLHIECDLSLGEISELKNISRQGVSDTINKTKEILLSYEEKLGLLSKKRQLIKLAEGLSDELKEEINLIIGE
ncbi:MAG: DNA-binding protein [Clostridia bacterium]|nr:DNA-binding protein [Clostridia bacterium]